MHVASSPAGEAGAARLDVKQCACFDFPRPNLSTTPSATQPAPRALKPSTLFRPGALLPPQPFASALPTSRSAPVRRRKERIATLVPRICAFCIPVWTGTARSASHPSSFQGTLAPCGEPTVSSPAPDLQTPSPLPYLSNPPPPFNTQILPSNRHFRPFPVIHFTPSPMPCYPFLCFARQPPRHPSVCGSIRSS